MGQEIRPLGIEGIRTAVDWARGEGWNPGLGDAAAFAAAAPDGFRGLFLDGSLAATISLVRYDADFAFLGFYICRPDLRGQGLGLKLWTAALEACGAETIGLDGVTSQQPNYRKSGFVLAHENIRHGGLRPGGYAQMDPDLRPLSPADAAMVSAYEQRQRLFPAPRPAFLRAWLANPALTLWRDGEIAGYGVIRQCHQGFKVGPLFAENVAGAETILRGLLTHANDGMFFLDTPAGNAAAADLALSLNLQPMFETARMYRGPAPDLDMSKVFGITTFELG